MQVYERIHSNLEYLKLNKINEIIENYIEIAVKKDIPLIEVIDYLLLEEKNSKSDIALKISTQIAGYKKKKSLEQFDFSFQPSIDKKNILELQTMRFIHDNENVVFLGPPGVGKTHLSIALGLEAIRSRLSVYYINCHELIHQLNMAQHENKLKQKLKTLSKHKLLIIDEVGYLPFDKQAANLFFQLISLKYEKSSIILTSNKHFGDWGEIFGDNVIASAILDRLLHHSSVISIKGQSYRIKNRKNTFFSGGDNK